MTEWQQREGTWIILGKRFLSHCPRRRCVVSWGCRRKMHSHCRVNCDNKKGKREREKKKSQSCTVDWVSFSASTCQRSLNAESWDLSKWWSCPCSPSGENWEEGRWGRELRCNICTVTLIKVENRLCLVQRGVIIYLHWHVL